MRITKSIICVVIIVLLSHSSYGQTTSEVDKTTYNMYLSQEWDSLIRYAKKNIDYKTNDYYYLRMRVGRAYFEKGDFVTAIKHFKKALLFNNSSALAQQYLYYSYKYLFRNTMARNVYNHMLQEVKKNTIPLKTKLIRSVKLEAGLNISDGIEKNIDNDLLIDEAVYGEAKYIGNAKYASVGIVHELSDALLLYHYINAFDIDIKKKFFNYEGDTSIGYNLQQFDYYLNTKYTFKSGLDVTMAIHTMSVSFPDYRMYYNDISNEYIIDKQDVSFTDILLYAGVGKYYKKTYVKIGMGLSQINDIKQSQVELDISWFPFGNYSLVPGVKVVSYSEGAKNGKEAVKRFIIEPHAIISFNNNIWITTSYTFGSLYNYFEKEGGIVYNNPDKVTAKANAEINYKLNKHIIFSIRYTYMNRESNSLYYEYTDYKESIFDFKTHYIIGGITWDI